VVDASAAFLGPVTGGVMGNILYKQIGVNRRLGGQQPTSHDPAWLKAAPPTSDKHYC